MKNASLSLGFSKAALTVTVLASCIIPAAQALDVIDTVTASIAPTGKFDLKSNVLIVRTTPYATIRGYVVTGFNGGVWDGFGIDSSSAAALYPTALGIINNSVAQFPSFAGVTLGANTESLVKYTYYGDADLSGTVNSDDFNLFLDGFNGNSPADWLFGDFDYSGSVNSDDFNIFLDGFNFNGPPLLVSPGGGGKEVVPEPSAVALFGISGVGLLARRRRGISA